MLWALASSAFVIYLYRKLGAEEADGTAPSEMREPSGTDLPHVSQALEAEINGLNERISALERLLSKA